jgi:large subunit ribosomal protein L10
MNRDQKTAAIAEIAAHIQESQAIFAVDYRGISVPQVAELRANLRDADATFKVVKNSLTERAADAAGVATLKDFLTGPTALTFIRGDVATAAKAIADYSRATQLLPFKGGLMGGDALDVDQLRALSRLPSREALYGQLVGVVASPVSGLVRTLSALLGGLAVALGQVREKMESGEIPAGAASAPAAAAAAEPPAGAEAPATEAEATEAEATAAEEPQTAEEPPAGAEAPATEATAVEEPQAAESPARVEAPESEAPESEAPAPEAPAAEEPAAEEPAADVEAPAAEAEAQAAEERAAEAASPSQDEPETEPAQEDDNKANASAQEKPDAAADSAKED